MYDQNQTFMIDLESPGILRPEPVTAHKLHFNFAPINNVSNEEVLKCSRDKRFESLSPSVSCHFQYIALQPTNSSNA